MKGIFVGVMLSLSPAFANAFPSAVDRAEALAFPVPARELEIAPVASEPEGLSSLAVTDRKSDAKFKVYFDAASSQVAQQSIPILAAFYREIASLVVFEPAKVEWAPVLFARNAEVLVLTRKPGETLWKIDVAADGRLSPDGVKTLYQVIPHEQVHSTQHIGHTNIVGLPRWFSEGQATWAGLLITQRWTPELARETRAKRTAAFASAKLPLALVKWGGFQPKLEAILRQLTPDQRAQYEKDPSTVSLSGAFTFEENDYTQDESNTLARYGASLALFDRIDKQAGREALLVWFKAVQQAGKQVTSEQLAALALQHTKIDIAAELK